MLTSSIIKQRSLAPLLFLFLTLTGCANVGPYVEPAQPDPEPAGPGLFTGEKGYYSAGGEPKEPDHKVDSDPKSDADSFAEFEAYQRWKSEERMSDEYREFKQWQEYKKWKSEQNK